jgi:hypothetical protein
VSGVLCAGDGAAQPGPGRYFRLLLLGYFEGLDSERGIAWRAADSLAVRSFVGLGLDTVASDVARHQKAREFRPAAPQLSDAGAPATMPEEVGAWGV